MCVQHKRGMSIFNARSIKRQMTVEDVFIWYIDETKRETSVGVFDEYSIRPNRDYTFPFF